MKPTDAACIIETDCNVDFEPPVGYDEYLAEQKVLDYRALPLGGILLYHGKTLMINH